MSEINEKIETLRLFNHKVKELQDGNFYRYLQEHKSVGIKIGGKIAPGIETNYPDEEAVRSFILTLRFFIDDKDGCSFRCLSKIYPTLPIPGDLIDKYKLTHKSINEYLDSNMHVNISSIGPITNREILNNIVYGHYAHVNPEKKEILNNWFISSTTELFIKFEFICILTAISDILPYVVEINKEALKHLL